MDFNLTSPPVATLEVGRFLSQTFIKKTHQWEPESLLYI